MDYTPVMLPFGSREHSCDLCVTVYSGVQVTAFTRATDRDNHLYPCITNVRVTVWQQYHYYTGFSTMASICFRIRKHAGVLKMNYGHCHLNVPGKRHPPQRECVTGLWHCNLWSQGSHIPLFCNLGSAIVPTTKEVGQQHEQCCRLGDTSANK